MTRSFDCTGAPRRLTSCAFFLLFLFSPVVFSECVLGLNSWLCSSDRRSATPAVWNPRGYLLHSSPLMRGACLPRERQKKLPSHRLTLLRQPTLHFHCVAVPVVPGAWYHFDLLFSSLLRSSSSRIDYHAPRPSGQAAVTSIPHRFPPREVHAFLFSPTGLSGVRTPLRFSSC